MFSSLPTLQVAYCNAIVCLYLCLYGRMNKWTELLEWIESWKMFKIADYQSLNYAAK